MTFDEKYAPLYRRVFEFHKRHSGAKTEADIEKMALDESCYCEKNPDFSAALWRVVCEEVMRGHEKGRCKE